MPRHLISVKVAAPAPPHAFQGWCETCHRDIGPRFEAEDVPVLVAEAQAQARKIVTAHEENPTLSDYALVDQVRRIEGITAAPGRTDA